MTGDEKLNIIRKIVWSFVKRYSWLEFEELFSEACLAYLEAFPKYDPKKGKESTFIYTVVKNHINGLLRKQKKEQREILTDVLSDKDAMETLLKGREKNDPEHIILAKEQWIELLASFSPEAQAICDLVNEGDVYFDVNKPRQARGIIARELEKEGWKMHKVWETFREIKTTLAVN